MVISMESRIISKFYKEAMSKSRVLFSVYLIHCLNSIARSYKANLHRASLKHDILK